MVEQLHIDPQAKLAGKRVLVTGGRGFVGAAVSDRLRTLGAQVYTVGRTPPAESNGFHLVADLQSAEATYEVFEAAQPEYVMHLASHVVGARSLDVVLSTLHSNLTSTVNLLMAAKTHECQRVVLTGSLEEPDPSSQWPVPSSPYAAAKLAAGAYGRMFNALFELPVVILRVFMVYGPGPQDVRKLVPYAIGSLLKGEQPQFSSGTREVDWVYVADVAEAFLHAAAAPDAPGGTFDVGSGELTSVRKVVELIHELSNAPAMPEFGGTQDRPMEQIRQADLGHSKQTLGWSPRTSLRDGLQSTIEWFSRES